MTQTQLKKMPVHNASPVLEFFLRKIIWEQKEKKRNQNPDNKEKNNGITREWQE